MTSFKVVVHEWKDPAMHPYAIHLLARTIHEERLAEAEAFRRGSLVRRSSLRKSKVESVAAAPATDAVCSTA